MKRPQWDVCQQYKMHIFFFFCKCHFCCSTCYSKNGEKNTPPSKMHRVLEAPPLLPKCIDSLSLKLILRGNTKSMIRSWFVPHKLGRWLWGFVVYWNLEAAFDNKGVPKYRPPPPYLDEYGEHFLTHSQTKSCILEIDTQTFDKAFNNKNKKFLCCKSIVSHVV